VLTLALGAFVGGALAVQTWTLRLLLEDDARGAAVAWTRFISGKTGDFGHIAAGETPSPDTQQYLKWIESSSRIFRYRIFGTDGLPRYTFDRVSDPARASITGVKPDPNVQMVAHSGMPFAETGSRKAGSTIPFRYYAKSYVPAFTPDGKVEAVVEVYIDQTDKHAEFAQVSMIGATSIALLLAIAFGVPAIAWYRGEQAKRKTDDRLRYLTSYDPLSNLPNRARLTEELAGILAGMGPATRLAVLSLDIDRFTDLNDWLGLAAGDQIIRIVAERLRTAVQEYSGENLVARISSDEFAVIARSCMTRADAMLLAEKITRAMARPLTLGSRQIRLSACIGVALAPIDGDDAERLLKSANLALVKGKQQGRGRIQFFTPDLDSEMEARRAVEQAVTTAFAHGGFLVHYQPICSAKSGTVVGFEALARLPTESGNFIPPGIFVPAMERMGLISQLGSWMLTEACTAAAVWPEPMSVSVNLSALQFSKPGIADIVAATLKSTGLAPHRLHLEITESMLLADHEGAMAELVRLKALGTWIVMDDFGTGYSSLSYLWRFPFDKIKIDSSFMTGLEGPGAPAAKVMRAIANLGHSLGMVVCVEGVETYPQAISARDIGCDEMQGFHFGRPIPALDLPALIMADFQRSLPKHDDIESSADSAAL
jgi:diguanylate cyclase (GGDEF)-like protein